MRGWWFSLGTLVSSNNKTDYHDITEILRKVVLNTITRILTQNKLTESANEIFEFLLYID
jgi:hypothetical protein